MSDKTVDATDVKVISLLDVFTWILTLVGFGKGIGAVLSQIAATTVTEAKTASEAVLNALAAGKDVIIGRFPSAHRAFHLYLQDQKARTIGPVSFALPSSQTPEFQLKSQTPLECLYLSG